LVSIGDRFGELTVVRELSKGERTHSGQGREWMCECDCGLLAIRTTGQLNQSRRDGRAPCCAKCLRELRGGSWYERQRMNVERFHNRMEEWGSLWSPFDEEDLRYEIREGVAECLGFYPSAPDPRLERVPVPRSDEPYLLPSPCRTVLPSTVPFRAAVERVRRWLRWQTAVDFAMDGWASGLPRQAVEKMLYDPYIGST
jgi:hypothetical protein